MSIDVTCNCGTKYRVSDGIAGRQARCKRCGVTIRVPVPAANAAADPLCEALEPGGNTPMGDPLRVPTRQSKRVWSVVNVKSMACLAAMAGILVFVVICWFWMTSQRLKPHQSRCWVIR